MFTINQIKEAHSKVKSGADFPKYIQELKKLSVVAYNIYVTDGHAEYTGAGNFTIASESKYPLLNIAETGSKEKLAHSLSIHQQGQTDYLTFCKQAAEAGVEKWTVHVVEMTCTYYDKTGNKLLVEKISVP
ncbi:MAG: DUF1398 family protein [Daejeonella sp.]